MPAELKRSLRAGICQTSFMHRHKTKTVLVILALLLVAFLAWVKYQPRLGRPNVSVKVIGYTNDTDGARLAVIGVANLSPSKIFVYLPTIQMQAPGERLGFTNYFQGGTNQWHRLHSYLDPGASVSFALPPPTNQSPWRLSMNAYNDFGAIQFIKRFTQGGRYMPFRIEGDWVGGEK